MPTVEYRCDDCGYVYRTTAQRGGRTTCPRCGSTTATRLVEIPDPPDAPKDYHNPEDIT